MDVLVMIGQLLLALSILVGVHEAGHMFAAKFFGMRVEKFSIGFPPKIFGFKKGETEYSIGSIPLGGFVKITGMIDESLDTKNLSQEPQPYEFRAKPAWQRLIVMIGGITVNVIVGVLIYSLVIYFYGEEYIPAQEVNKKGIVAYPLAQQIGLKTGDKIIAINGKPLEKFNDVYSPEVLFEDNGYYTVLRDGKELRVNIPKGFLDSLSDKKDEFITPVYPFQVGKLRAGDNAEKAGVKEGDKIVGVNGSAVNYFHEFKETLGKNKGKTIDLKVDRGGKIVDLKVLVSDEGTIGFSPKFLLDYKTEYFGLGQSIAKGTEGAFSAITNTVKAFGKMFKGELSPQKSLSGPIGIAREFGGIWIWQKFWTLTAFLSMILAFMNLLPIPALDGGHVMFLGYEIVSGRKPSDKFLEIAQKIGMVILLGLMVFAFGNDIFKFFR